MNNDISVWLKEKLEDKWHPAQIEAMAFFTAGAIRAKSFVVAKAGQCGVEGTGTLPRHGVKRANRLLKNEHFTTEQMNESSLHIFKGIIKKCKQVTLVIDWTVKNDFMLLSISYRDTNGYVIPIAWNGYKKNELGEVESQNKFEEELLWKVYSVIPYRVKIILLADRGFDRPEFIKFVRNLGKNMQYVIRLSSGSFIIQGKKEIEISDALISKGKSKSYGNVLYTKEKKIPIRFISLWDEGCDEPWHIATNIAHVPAKEFRWIYAERMGIEGMFKHMKNEVTGMSLKHARLRDIQRWIVLCFLATLIMLFFFVIARALKKENLDIIDAGLSLARHKLRCRKRKRSFSDFYIILYLATRNALKLKILLRGAISVSWDFP